MASIGTRIKDAAAQIFVRAENNGVFEKLPAFKRDLSEYPELAVLAQNYETIRDECLALIGGGVKIPGMDELTSYTSGGIHQIAWKSFMFKSGSFIDENCALAPKTAARNVPEIRLRPRVARPRTTSSWIASSAAIVGVASASSSYPDRASARCASARTNTDPNRRASTPSVRVRRSPRRGLPTSSPSRSSQCCSCRRSASASASRISRSSPVRRDAMSR